MEENLPPFEVWFNEVIYLSEGSVCTKYKGFWYEVFEFGLTPQQAILSHIREAQQ